MIKLRAIKINGYYRIQKLNNGKVVSELEHNFKSWLSACVYGNRINNTLLDNYIPENKQPYKWINK